MAAGSNGHSDEKYLFVAKDTQHVWHAERLELWGSASHHTVALQEKGGQDISPIIN